MPPSTSVLTQGYFWSVVAGQFQDALFNQEDLVSEKSGLYKEFGPPGEYFTGETEGRQNIEELAGILARAAAMEMERCDSEDSLAVGRPPDVIIPTLGPMLLQVFLRYNATAGRRSVLTWVDGDYAQEETGPFFEFLQLVLVPLNEFLVNELHRRPISAARLARIALFNQ
jgi:hypothetical protein